ncbi:DUF1707 SHOCT-like domain-containing protein [Actinomycetota bacterium Odt1-20B]
MTELPEPADLSAADLRASDADRERVAERLRDAMAEGRLDMEEFEERLDATYKARTYGELAPLTRDLPGPGAPAPAPVPKVDMVKHPAAGGGSADPVAIDWDERVVGGEASSTWGFAFWGGFGRKGQWKIGRVFTAFTMWGGGEIDLREARFADRDVEIRLFTLMGGIQVVVPPDLQVSVRGIGIMGGFDDHATGEGTPGSPRVVIKGLALMGGIGVDRKMRRVERQRLREERRQDRLDRRDARRAAHWERAEEHRLRLERRRDR